MSQRGHGRHARLRVWAAWAGMLVAVVLLILGAMGTFVRPDAEVGTASDPPSSDSDGERPTIRDADLLPRTGSWKSGQALEEQAQRLLVDYRDEGRCVLTQAGYIDLAGRVWSCMVTGDGWVDLCVVRANEDGGSDVSVQRMEASSWEEEADASSGTDGDVA